MVTPPLHCRCTAGDILILLGAYWITSLMFRTRSWPTDRRYPALLVFIGCGFFYIAARRSLNALPTTDTELKLMAAAAITGLSRMPKNG